MDMVVHHGGQQIVRELDCVEVAGEMQIDIFHRHHLRMSAARGATLHAEHRSDAGLAQADHRSLADAIERVADAYRRRGFAFAGRRRTDGRHQDQLARQAARQTCR